MSHKVTFFQYVIPSILSFALAGVYAIVDGFFIGNSIGDAGLSSINIAYPIVALLQAIGTGIGMGGAVKYAIATAKGKQQEAGSKKLHCLLTVAHAFQQYYSDYLYLRWFICYSRCSGSFWRTARAQLRIYQGHSTGNNFAGLQHRPGALYAKFWRVLLSYDCDDCWLYY